MWIFGYGSLVWKADFPYEEKVAGYIKGYHRRFWQLSEDHRGVPGKPGRVVTLIPSDDDEACVWGIAYRVAEENAVAVSVHLDLRESNGYTRMPVTFHPAHGSETINLSVYIGKADNRWFGGLASEDEIAKQICTAQGPSGSNAEYLHRLADAMREMKAPDPYLFRLQESVIHMQERNDLSQRPPMISRSDRDELDTDSK